MHSVVCTVACSLAFMHKPHLQQYFIIIAFTLILFACTLLIRVIMSPSISKHSCKVQEACTSFIIVYIGPMHVPLHVSMCDFISVRQVGERVGIKDKGREGKRITTSLSSWMHDSVFSVVPQGRCLAVWTIEFMWPLPASHSITWVVMLNFCVFFSKQTNCPLYWVTPLVPITCFVRHHTLTLCVACF